MERNPLSAPNMTYITFQTTTASSVPFFFCMRAMYVVHVFMNLLDLLIKAAHQSCWVQYCSKHDMYTYQTKLPVSSPNVEKAKQLL